MSDTHENYADLAQQQKQSRIQDAMNANWQDYCQLLTSLPMEYEIAPSLKLLNVADLLMNQSCTDVPNNFADSSLVERYLIGGVEDNQTRKQYGFDTQLLGSMQGFASFKKVLRNDPEGLAKLLKIIPAKGRIDGWHFTQFVDGYNSLFAENGFKQTHLFPATRLLSMKRPDQFVAISADTVDVVCQAFSVKPLKKQDFQRYWDDIIVALQSANWFKAEQPVDAQQTPIFRARVALFERLICQPSDDYIASDTVDRPDCNNSLETKIESSGAIYSDNSGVAVRSSDPAPIKTPIKKKISQPKKMTIDKKKSAKVNKNAATKLMSQYYFANKEKFAKVNMSANRDKIIEKLIDGESVEEAFSQML